MNKNRLEAFSDGVIAIIITIMVLELKAPHDASLTSLIAVLPIFLSYILSFTFIGIYWNNHHHLLQIAKKVNGKVLWANLHLLFWLSLVPFATHYIGHNPHESMPVIIYSVLLLLCGAAYSILSKQLLCTHDDSSPIRQALQNHRKEQISILGYMLAVPLALINPYLSYIPIIGISIMWLIPDQRIEKHFEKNNH